MKCNTCIHEWYYAPDWTSPYGEHACLKSQEDLYGVKEEDVKNCPDYICKNKNNDYVGGMIEEIKVFNRREI